MQPNVMEVMSSVQGEGLLVGERQIFIRLAGCNLRCAYCDTPGSFEFAQPCKVETEPGTGIFHYLPNPVGIAQLVEVIRAYGPELHHSVSFTGGEPLLFTDYLEQAIPPFKELGLQIYLETNGTLAKELAVIAEQLDFISMDIKLPSTAGNQPIWQEHLTFLETARKSSAVTYVKVVVSQLTPAEELQQACGVIAAVDKGIPLIIQPVTPPENSLLRIPEPATLLHMQDICHQVLDTVKVIPQTHKMLGLL